jgi:hypothetical protein
MGELMKTNYGLQLQRIHARVIEGLLISSGLVLALLLDPYAVAQQSQNHDPSQVSSAASPAQSAKPQSTLATKPEDDDNAPVPPMPPLDPSELAPPSNSSDLLPDSPGAIESAQLETPQTPATQESQTQAQNSQPAAAQPPPAMPKEPLGTAAAETVPTIGIAASRPAGAALAPAKQHRIRTILIRTGAVVGAAAAVGVTMALTEASPGRPPGAH